MDKLQENFDKLINLVYELDSYIHTSHLDMGGKHKYSIWGKGHIVITKLKGFLYELHKEEKNGRIQ